MRSQLTTSDHSDKAEDVEDDWEDGVEAGNKDFGME